MRQTNLPLAICYLRFLNLECIDVPKDHSPPLGMRERMDTEVERRDQGRAARKYRGILS